MKRTIRCLLLALTILAAIVAATFVSCAQGTRPSEVDNDALNPSEAIQLSTQYPVYDKSCTWLSLLLTNNSEEPVSFGAEWSIEKSVQGSWRTLNFKEGFAFPQPLYTCGPNDVWATTCSLDWFEKPLTEGSYRVVKKIDDAWYTAEFEIGTSPITAKSPHGFVPLDELPEDYSQEDAIADGVVTFTGDCTGATLENPDKIDAFFRYATVPNWRGQMRIAWFKQNGILEIQDIAISRTGRIDFTVDNTRLFFDNGAEHPEEERGITTQYYSNFVTDGTAIALSNYNFYDKAREGDVTILAQKDDLLTNALESVTSAFSEEYDEKRLTVWSPDGTASVSCQAGTDTVGIAAAGWSSPYPLDPKLAGEGASVTELLWENDTVFLIVAEQADQSPQYYYEFVQIDREDMKNTARISYTSSEYRYEVFDGRIIIPE